MLKTIFHYCQGYSHLSSGKPCQDYALAETDSSLSMAIVSDGHGGDRYFRSDRGARMLVEITAEAIREFTDLVGDLGEIHLMTSENTEAPQPMCDGVHDKLRWLFSSIIAQWNDAVEQDASQSPLTYWEKENVDPKYLAEFEKAKTHEKIYGCTLMAYVQTPKYWFAFHIGDGKLLTMSMHDDVPVFAQPVPWDDKCFLNKTTSICDSAAIDEFRYCYCSDGSFPDAAFLGSDGLDDTYGDGALLEDFYMNVYLEVARGHQKAISVLKSDLPEISRRGSKDDMSVACVYDDSNILQNALKILDYQLSRIKDKHAETIAKIGDLNMQLMTCEAHELNEPERIQAMYIRKDINKLTSSLDFLTAKRKKIASRKGPFTKLLKKSAPL